MKIGNLSVIKDTTGQTVAFFCKDSIVRVTHSELHALELWSRLHNHQDVRLCLHQRKDDMFHQMIIVIHKGVYRKPHKEISPESYHIVKGTMMVIVFNEDGSIKSSAILDPKTSPLLRMGSNFWHVNIPISTTVVFVETKNGPFKSSQVQFAPWAPKGDREGRIYMQELVSGIKYNYLL